MMMLDRVSKSAFRLPIFLVFVVGATAATVAAGGVGGTVRADRQRMGFRNQGLYCSAFGPAGARPHGVKDLLPANRAVNTASWSFYIMQFDADLNPLFNPAAPSPYKQLFPELARHGKRVILDASIFDDDTGKLGPHPAATAFHHLAQTLKVVKPQWLYAVTLNEENVYWNGHAEVLAKVYHMAKKRWPDLPVYQWWTPMVGIDWTGQTGWRALPADGWVCDLYNMPRTEYERHVISFLHTGKPLVAILWASPQWPINTHSQFSTPAQWWRQEGARVLRDQLDICRAYNIPVAYFACQKNLFKAGKLVHPIYWAWQATDRITRAFYQNLELRAQEFRFTPSYKMDYRAVTPAKVRWSQGTPGVELNLSRTAKGMIQANWTDYLHDITLSVGTQARPHPNPYVAVSYQLDDQAVKALEHAATGFAVASADKRAVEAPLVLKIQPQRPVNDLSVTLDIQCIKALGGSYEVSSSADSRQWSAPKTGNHDRLVTIAGPARVKPSTDPLYIKIVLIANAGVQTNIACAFNELHVTETYP